MINRSSIHSFEQIFALQFSQTIKFTELTVSLSNNKPPSFEFKRHFDFKEPRRIIVETYNDFYAASPPPRKYRFIYNPRISRPQQDLEATPAFDGVSRTRFIRSGNRDGSRGRASIGVHAVSSSRKIESASGHRYRPRLHASLSVLTRGVYNGLCRPRGEESSPRKGRRGGGRPRSLPSSSSTVVKQDACFKFLSIVGSRMLNLVNCLLPGS